MYVLGIIDAFSIFIYVKALRNTKTCTTIMVLEDIFAAFGSSTGTSFTSGKFKELVKTLGSKHVLNAVATPRANGQIERYNRTILSSLAAINFDCNDADWDLKVPKIQWSLNNTVNRGTGKSPAEIVFGYRTTNPSEGIIKVTLDDGEAEEAGPSSENRTSIRETVNTTIERQQEKMKNRFDKRRPLIFSRLEHRK